MESYNARGEKIWEAEYDIYGKVRKHKGEKNFIPFRQLGQYEDGEVALYYNRFRYYDADQGNYISQDPIGLAGNNPTLYGYVGDSNTSLDYFGLADCNSWNAFQSRSKGLFKNSSEASKAYHLHKTQQWSALENLMGEGQWPPNYGFVSVTKISLPTTTRLDRYGHEGGKFVSPAGNSFGSRALPEVVNDPKSLHTYEVIKELEVESGPAIPWFGQEGMGTQYMLPDKVANLIKDGFLKRV